MSIYTGKIVHSIPSGQSGGAANYSGHNMRVNSFCLFLNRCKEEKKELFEEEKGLRDRLMECKIVQANKRGEYELVWLRITIDGIVPRSNRRF